MKKKYGLIFFLLRGIVERRVRFVAATLAVSLAVAGIVGMMGLTLGMRQKLNDALKAYGANITVTSPDGTGIDLSLVPVVSKMTTVDTVYPQLYGHLLMKDTPIEVVGVSFEQLRQQNWRVDGAWPRRRGEVLAGSLLREAMQLNLRDPIPLNTSSGIRTVRVAGFFERGSHEDRSIILDLDEAGRLLGRPGVGSMLFVRSRASAVVTIEQIKKMGDGLTVKSLRRVTAADEALLSKMQFLMISVSIVIFLAAMISVGSTMGTTVLERREEIGLMKALGATRRMIARFYSAEAFAMGMIGGCIGLVAGVIFAEMVSRGAFGSYVAIPAVVGLLALVIGVSVAVTSAVFPVRDALRPEAAEILRGE